MKDDILNKLKGIRKNLDEDLISLREVNKLIENNKANKENIINHIKQELISKNLINENNDLSFNYLDNLIKINVLEDGKIVNTFSIVFEFSDRYYVCKESPKGFIYINQDLKIVKDELIKLQNLNFKDEIVPTTTNNLYAKITHDGAYLLDNKDTSNKTYKNIFIKKEDLPKELLENNIRQKSKRR